MVACVPFTTIPRILGFFQTRVTGRAKPQQHPSEHCTPEVLSRRPLSPGWG